MNGWQEVVSSMDYEHEHMLRGGTVSNFFLRESLTLSHPVFVGGCYGLMISVALLLPLYYGDSQNNFVELARDWGLQSLVIVSMLSLIHISEPTRR